MGAEGRRDEGQAGPGGAGEKLVRQGCALPSSPGGPTLPGHLEAQSLFLSPFLILGELEQPNSQVRLFGRSILPLIIYEGTGQEGGNQLRLTRQ